MNEAQKSLERLKMPEIPKTYEDALTVAKSLVSWIDFLKDNELKVDNPYGSFGGHIDFHLATLNVWNVEMKIKSNAKTLKDLMNKEGKEETEASLPK